MNLADQRHTLSHQEKENNSSTSPPPSSEGNSTFHFDKYSYNKQIHELIVPTVCRFRKIARAHVFIHLSIAALLMVELVLFVLFFATLAKSSYLAASLAAIFITVFSYFLIRIYLQTKKPEQFIELRDDFLHSCQNLMRDQEGIPEYHLALANALSKCSAYLQGAEQNFYPVLSFRRVNDSLSRQLSCCLHWKDVLRMRELLLLRSVEEHLKLVKCEPINLEVHAALANAYVLLSGLYADPHTLEVYDDALWIPSARSSDTMQQKFRQTAERAVEELKILNHYAPDDPWVHAQLAYSYHDLQMPEAEIREYETILSLRPDDQDTLFKLGMLYFQQGHNAKGLEIYEALKHTHYKRAESLIKFYGAHAPLEPFSDV